MLHANTSAQKRAGDRQVVIRLQLSPHRFQAFSRGIMSVIDFAALRQRRPSPRRNGETGTVTIRCRIFEPGHEDWSRGLRELKCIVAHAGAISREADGSVCLRGLPAIDLKFDPAQVAQILRDGLKITSSGFEAEISAADFRAALPPRLVAH